MPQEFKKVNLVTFDGEMKKLEDAKAWLLGMKKFFKLHNYAKNMNAKIYMFSLIKWKADI